MAGSDNDDDLLAELEAELEAEGLITSPTHSVHSQKAQSTEVKIDQDAIQRQLRQLEEENEALKKELSDLQQVKQTVVSAAEAKSSEVLENEQVQISELRTKIVSLQNTNTQLNKDVESTKSSAEDQRKLLESSITDLSQKNAALQAKLADPEAEPKASGKEILELKEVYQITTKKLVASEETVASLNSTIKGLRDQLQSSCKDVEKWKKRATSVEAARKQSQTEIDEMMGKLETAKTSLKELKESKSATDLNLDWNKNKLEQVTEELNQTKRKLAQAKEESAQIRAEYKVIVEAMQNSEQDKEEVSSSLQKQVDEMAAEAKEHASESKKLRAELEQNKESLAKLEKENVKLKITAEEVEGLRVSRKDNDSTIAQLNKAVQNLQAMNIQLEEQQTAIKNENEMLVTANKKFDAKLDGIEATATEAKTEAAETNAELSKIQEANDDLVAEKMKLEEEVDALSSKIMTAEKKIDSLTQQLTAIKIEYQDSSASKSAEITYLTSQLNKEMQKSEKLEVALEDSVEQQRIQKKKQDKVNKDLARQLQSARKKEKQMLHRTNSSDSLRGGHDSPADSPQLSNRSDHEFASTNKANAVLSGSAAPSPSRPTQDTTLHAAPVSNVAAVAATNRLGKLRKEVDKRDDRITFYESHCADLTADIQRKSRIIQEYMLRERSGKLLPLSENPEKVHHATFSMGSKLRSMFHRAPATSMTLELALEINQKLQEVLEDTLLKNIQLKESLDTVTQPNNRKGKS